MSNPLQQAIRPVPSNERNRLVDPRDHVDWPSLAELEGFDCLDLVETHRQASA